MTQEIRFLALNSVKTWPNAWNSVPNQKTLIFINLLGQNSKIPVKSETNSALWKNFYFTQNQVTLPYYYFLVPDPAGHMQTATGRRGKLPGKEIVHIFPALKIRPTKQCGVSASFLFVAALHRIARCFVNWNCVIFAWRASQNCTRTLQKRPMNFVICFT